MSALQIAACFSRWGFRIAVLCCCACLFDGENQSGDSVRSSIPVNWSKDQVKGTYVGYSEFEFYFYRLDLNVDKESQFIVILSPWVELAPERKALIKPVVYHIKTWFMDGAKVHLSGESDHPRFRQVEIDASVLPGQSMKIEVSGAVLGSKGKTVLFGEMNLKKSMELAAKAAHESKAAKPANSAKEGEVKKKPNP